MFPKPSGDPLVVPLIADQCLLNPLGVNDIIGCMHCIALTHSLSSHDASYVVTDQIAGTPLFPLFLLFVIHVHPTRSHYIIFSSGDIFHTTSVNDQTPPDLSPRHSPFLPPLPPLPNTLFLSSLIA